jgi:uncharacterized protein
MEGYPAGRAAALWAGLHLVVLLVLSGLVVRERRRHGVVIGDAGVPELLRAQRAFGNAVEYVAPGLGALAVLAVAGAPAAAVHVIGGCLFTGRVVHGVALSRDAGPSLGRTVGMGLTWTALIAAAAVLLVYGI